jgi:hypothetical protein
MLLLEDVIVDIDQLTNLTLTSVAGTDSPPSPAPSETGVWEYLPLDTQGVAAKHHPYPPAAPKNKICQII